MKKINLDDCTRASLEETFGLRKSIQNSILDSWLQTEVALSDYEKAILETFQAEFILNSEA